MQTFVGGLGTGHPGWEWSLSGNPAAGEEKGLDEVRSLELSRPAVASRLRWAVWDGEEAQDLRRMCEQGRVEKALDGLSRMELQGRVPRVQTYVLLLQVCSRKKSLAEGRRLHAHIARTGMELDSFLGELVVSMLVESGGLQEAVCVFRRLWRRTEVSWTAVISGYSKGGRGLQALRLYQEMREDGVEPSKYTLLSLLKACGGLADLGQGKRIHAEVVRFGCGGSLFVSTALVDMYARCGSMVDARQVFDKLVQRDVVLWNVMIAGYVQQEDGGMALELFEQMQGEGVQPDERTIVSVLKACGCLAVLEGQTLCDGQLVKACSLRRVRSIHSHKLGSGYKRNAYLASTLIHVYAACGSMEEAQNVFESLSHREVVAWTALISGFVQHQQGEKALQLYAQMEKEGVMPNERTFVSLLSACADLAGSDDGLLVDGHSVKAETLQKGKLLHSEAVRRRFEQDTFVANTLMDMYCKCGSLVDARKVFDSMAPRTVVSWNVMMAGYAEQNDAEKVLQLYDQMQVGSGVKPNDRTYVSVLKSCDAWAAEETGITLNGQIVKVLSLQKVKAVHVDVIRNQFASNSFVANTLIQVYSMCGSIEDARRVFDTLSEPEVVSWSAMITAYAHQEQGGMALELYHKMQDLGIPPNEPTFLSVLKACSNSGALDMCRQIHEHIRIHGFDWSTRVANSLLHAYGKCGSMVDARRLFISLPEPDVVSWSTLISGYARQGNCDMSFHCFEEMQQAGMQPNAVTFLSLLSACSHAGLVDKGLKYFESMRKDYDIPAGSEHYVSVVDLLGRAGFVRQAYDLICNMPTPPDHRVWLSLLGACRKHVNVQIGRRAFECAIRLDPRHGAAYVLMANIYAHLHMLDEEQEVESVRVGAGAWKKAAQCWIEHGKQVHTFVVNTSGHQQSLQVYTKLRQLNAQLQW